MLLRGRGIPLRKVQLILMLICLFLLTGCSNVKVTNGKTLDEVIQKSPSLNRSIILQKEFLENGVIVFHIPNIMGDDDAKSTLGAEYVSHTLWGWEVSYKGGSYSSGISQTMYYQYFPKTTNSPFPMVYGEITEPKITKVLVADLQNKTKQGGKIINVKKAPGIKNDMRIWYALLDKSHGPTIEIDGMTANAEVLFSDREEVRN